MKNKLFTLSCIAFSFLSVGQIESNLRFSNPQLTNPALTGIFSTPQINLSTTNMFGKYNNTYLDYSQYSNKLHGGVGAYSNNFFFSMPDSDKIISSNSLGFSYAYQNNINDNWHYSVGSSFNLGIANSPYTGNPKSQLQLGFNVGGLIYTKSFFASVNYGYVHQKDLVNISPQALRVSSGYKFKPFKNADLFITPTLYYTHRYGYGDLSANLEVQFKKLHIGAGIGNGRPNASIGYDFNKFRLNYNVGGGFGSVLDHPEYTIHQLSIKFNLKNKNNSNRSSFDLNLF